MDPQKQIESWQSYLKKLNLNDWWSIVRAIVIAVVTGAIGVAGCSQINRYLGLEDDHPIEERAEQEIKESLGLEVDLSSDSPECEKPE